MTLDRARIAELTAREAARLDERTPASAAMYARARQTLAGGVASSYQARAPWPIYLERGEGAHVWDVDGNKMVDFHNGFGSMVQGHAHPAITKAVTERIALGTHFAAPTHDAVVVAEELKRRWGLPRWRYVELRVRGDHGRDPDRARADRPGHDREDLRLVPRPPRLRDGLDRGALRRDRRP